MSRRKQARPVRLLEDGSHVPAGNNLNIIIKIKKKKTIIKYLQNIFQYLNTFKSITK